MLKSSLISACWMAIRLDFRECLWKYASFGRNILKLMFRTGLADEETVKLRNESCRSCQMFHVVLGTCGVPGDVFPDPQTGKIKSFGCWCDLSLSNRIASKDCWARANGLDLGWPDAIRPHHKE